MLASSPIVGTTAQVIYGSSNYSPRQLHGVNSDYLVVRNWPLHSGEFFSERDVHAANKVCVIGHTLVGKLFQTTDPIGQSVRIKNIPFRVIGVLATKGANMVGDDQDSIILMPLTTVRKRLQGSEFDNVNAILASARSLLLMTQAQHEIEELLTERHRVHFGEKRDFTVENTTEIANTFGVVTGTLTAMLAAIAGISLVVGGVGIMNIMLVSVTERTREIGIRMAVGARTGDILRQFLVEAVLLSSIGGIVGFALGVGASIGIVSIINAVSSGQKWTNRDLDHGRRAGISVRGRGRRVLRLLPSPPRQPVGPDRGPALRIAGIARRLRGDFTSKSGTRRRCRAGQDFERERIVAVADRAPERECRFVVNEHVDRQALRLGPDLGSQHLDRLPADSLTPAVANDEELAEMDLVRLLAVQGVGDDRPLFFQQDRRVVTGKPSRHPLDELGQAHRIAMTFVSNQLVIEAAEKLKVVTCGATVSQNRHPAFLSFPSSCLGTPFREAPLRVPRGTMAAAKLGKSAAAPGWNTI